MDFQPIWKSPFPQNILAEMYWPKTHKKMSIKYVVYNVVPTQIAWLIWHDGYVTLDRLMQTHGSSSVKFYTTILGRQGLQKTIPQKTCREKKSSILSKSTKLKSTKIVDKKQKKMFSV